MGNPHRRRGIAVAAGALLMLAGVVGASGAAWATPADPSAGRMRENPLPKVAIVFSQMSPAGDGVQLRIGDPLGLMSRGLTARSPGVVDDHASRSPDGWLVLFERTTDQGSDIGIVHIAEPGVVTIVDTGCRTTPDCAGAVRPTWSFDGSRVLFTRVMAPIDGSGVAASAALYSVNLDGSDLQRVSSPDLAQGTEEGEVKFSPDGRRRVFVRVTSIGGVRMFAIFKSDADGSHARQMTPWELDAGRPSISPAVSGSTAGLVVFDVADDRSVGSRDVALMPLACDRIDECTRWTRYVTHDHPGPWSAFGASWSPDGRSLSYAVETARGAWATIWTATWDGTWTHPMTGWTNSFSPSWGQ
ncbi:TolB family protein [Microbacterium sp. P5_E9]